MTTMQPTPDAALPDPARVRTINRLTALWVLTGFILLLVLGLAGLLMRAMQSGILGNAAHTWFYPILTLHGIGMVALVALVPLAGCWYISAQRVPMSTRPGPPSRIARGTAVMMSSEREETKGMRRMLITKPAVRTLCASMKLV